LPNANLQSAACGTDQSAFGNRQLAIDPAHPLPRGGTDFMSRRIAHRPQLTILKHEISPSKSPIFICFQDTKIRQFKSETVHQIDKDFVQRREQFVNLIVGCLMRILLLLIAALTVINLWLYLLEEF
jgi:hypothetical protein